jgi:hypothetical protein
MPRADTDLIGWAGGFSRYISENWAQIGLTEAQLGELDAAVSQFSERYNGHVTAQAMAQAAKQEKDAARAELVDLVRGLVRQIQANPSVTNAERQAMGISLRGERRKIAPLPQSSPHLTIDTSRRLRHIIAFMDEAGAGRGKPDGVLGCEIWVNVGDERPSGPEQMQFLGLDTRSPHTTEFRGEDVGKTAYYMARWTNRRGQPGPWSRMGSATVVG